MASRVHSFPLDMKIKKHYCSCCGEKLVMHPKTRMIRRGDPDHNEYSRFNRKMRILGDIELTEYDFKCLSCEKHISYDEQCVIEEIQKYVGARTLSQDNIDENYEKAKETLERKKRVRTIINKLLGAAVVILIIYYWFKSGNLSFGFYF